jgi:hypothetical protein
MTTSPRILYCHCTYAQVVPKEIKAAVLAQLADSNLSFEAVADLCEMSARRDPALQRLSAGGPLKIAACYPRAVKWLFHAANAPLSPTETEVINLRVASAEDAARDLFDSNLHPNLPSADSHPAAAPASVES